MPVVRLSRILLFGWNSPSPLVGAPFIIANIVSTLLPIGFERIRLREDLVEAVVRPGRRVPQRVGLRGHQDAI